MLRIGNPWTNESVRAHRALRGVSRRGGTLLILSSREKGVSRQKEKFASSGTGSERAQVRDRSGEEAPREPVRRNCRLSRATTTAVRCVAFRSFLLLLAVFPSACGYTFQGSPGSRFADPGIRVDLRPFANDSFVPDAGAFLASRLRDEMQRNGFRGTYERSMADYLIEGTVREIREEVSSLGTNQFALEHRMTIVVDIRVVEVKGGRLLWKEEGISEAAFYYAGTDFQYTESNRRMAFEEICRRIGRKIGQTLKVIL